MLNNFIYAQTKDLFLEHLGAGNILDEAIVFIEDTKEIWNHGTFFGGASDIDPKIMEEIEAAIEDIKSNKADKSEIPDLTGYATKTDLEAKQDVISDLDEIRAASTNGIFNVVCEQTTYDELKAAYDAGKTCICRYNNRNYILFQYEPVNNGFYFTHLAYFADSGEKGGIDNCYISAVKSSTESTGLWWEINWDETERIANRVDEISSSNMFNKYPSVEAVYNYAAAKTDLDTKQDVISDLATIRANAAKGATALQSVPAEYITETELTNKGYSTTTYVDQQISSLVDSAPETLNTLGELATALKNNQDVVDAINGAITNKADVDGEYPEMTVGTALSVDALIIETDQLGENLRPELYEAAAQAFQNGQPIVFKVDIPGGFMYLKPTSALMGWEADQYHLFVVDGGSLTHGSNGLDEGWLALGPGYVVISAEGHCMYQDFNIYLHQNGDGTKFLADNGEYKEISTPNSIIVPADGNINVNEMEEGKFYFGYYKLNPAGFYFKVNEFEEPIRLPLDNQSVLSFPIEQDEFEHFYIPENYRNTVASFAGKVLEDTTSAFVTEIEIDGETYTGISKIQFLGSGAGSSNGHYFTFESIGSNPIVNVSFNSFGGNLASLYDHGRVNVTFTEPENVDLSEYAKLTDIPAMIIDVDNYVATEESITKLFSVLESGGSLVFKYKVTTNDVYVWINNWCSLENVFFGLEHVKSTGSTTWRTVPVGFRANYETMTFDILLENSELASIEYVDNALANVNVDLSEYAKLSDIPSHDNFVTKEELKKSELGSVRVLLTDEGFAPITQDVENGFYYGITERNETGIFMKMGDALLQIPDSTRLTIEVTGTDELGYAILTEESVAKIHELFAFTNMTSPTFTVPACFVNYPHTGVSQTYISGMAFICYDNNIEKHVLYFHGITEDGSIVNVTATSGSNTGLVKMSVSIEQPATKTEVQEIVTSMSENELVVSAALTNLNERFDELQGGSATQTQITELQQTIQTLQTEIANIKAELAKTLNIE